MNLRLAPLTLVGFIQSPSPYPQRLRFIKDQPVVIRQNDSFLQVPKPFSKRTTLWSPPSLPIPLPSSSKSKSSSKLEASATAFGIGFDLEPALYMSLLAIQFACQPILTKKFTPKSINRTTVIISQDITKILMSIIALIITNNWKTVVVTQNWTIASYITVALPALLYAIQNFATLVAYQNLAPLTFNVLNQTKTLSAAFCCYIFLGKVQSKVQIMSLMLLFLSACIIEKLIPLGRRGGGTSGIGSGSGGSSDSSNSGSNSNEKSPSSSTSSLSTSNVNGKETKVTKKSSSSGKHVEGVIAVLLASFISGLAGALTQRILQSSSSATTTTITSGGASAAAVANVGRNTYLFTIELSTASLLFVLLSSLRSIDGKRIKENGFFHNWTPKTIIPILTNAAGGIVVGLVTKYSGAVKKGFALIFGLVLSGLLQTIFSTSSVNGDNGNNGNSNGNGDESKLSLEQAVGAGLAALSLWMHSSYPAKY